MAGAGAEGADRASAWAGLGAYAIQGNLRHEVRIAPRYFSEANGTSSQMQQAYDRK
jgi:hypothetical protein